MRSPSPLKSECREQFRAPQPPFLIRSSGVRWIASRLRRAWRGLLQRGFHARLRLSGVELGRGAYLAHGTKAVPGTVIGDGTRVNGRCVFKGSARISIGRYCAIGDAVRVISSNHQTDRANLQRDLQLRLGLPDLKETRGPVTIGHNVWMGDAVIVLPGVTIGNGAVIAAGAVVTRDVPPFAVVAGSPARVVRTRFSEDVIERLQAIQWWNWPEDRMRANRGLFEADLTSAVDLSVLSALR